MEVSYWICNLLIITTLLHRQLFTSKQLWCWLGGSCALLKGLSHMCWHQCRVLKAQTVSGRVWQQQTSWKWLHRFTDPGTFSLLLSLTAPILFFSSKMLSAIGRNNNNCPAVLYPLHLGTFHPSKDSLPWSFTHIMYYYCLSLRVSKFLSLCHPCFFK